MVKVIGPALSISAQGSLKKTLTFQNRPSGSALYLNSHPGRRSPWNPTSKQIITKEAYAEANVRWKELTTSEQQQWNDYVV